MDIRKKSIHNSYQGKLGRTYVIQALLSAVIFLCLESIYLYSSSFLFSPTFSYFSTILLLTFVALVERNTSSFLYWKIRPKVNVGFFLNIDNIVLLLIVALCSFIFVIRPIDNNLSESPGQLTSAVLMLGLPAYFYSWLVFKKTNQQVLLIAGNREEGAQYHQIETYVIIVLVAVFGIVFDFIPNNVIYLLWAPLLLLLILSLVSITINSFQRKWVLKTTQQNIQKPMSADEEAAEFLYEFDPYFFEENIEQQLLHTNNAERKKIFTVLKRIAGIDFLPLLSQMKTQAGTDLIFSQELDKTIAYLEKIKGKVKEVNNPYEFVEQSTDILTIKGLLRLQADNPDKNLVIKLLNDNRDSVQKAACIIAGKNDDINFISILIEHLQNPELSVWAQFSLKNIGLKAVKYLEIEFSKRKSNTFFVEACFEVLGKVRGPNSQDLLYAALNEPNKYIKLAAAKKIIAQQEHPDTTKRKYFGNLFDRLIINQLINEFLLKEIESQNEIYYQLSAALREERKENTQLIKGLLKIYYSSNTVDLIFANYGTTDVHKHAFCNHLIDLLFSDNFSVLTKVKALFSPGDSQLMEFLEEEFPGIQFRRSYKNGEELIWDILKMDYRRISNWTRACAIRNLQHLHTEDIPFELASEFLNDDQLMKETAALCIYKNISEFYTIFLKRLPKAEAGKLDFAIRSNLEYTTTKLLRDDNLLLFDKIQFLLSIPYLKELSVNELNIYEKYFKVKVLAAGDHTLSTDEDSFTGFWIVENGHVNFSENGTDFVSYNKRDIFEVKSSIEESGKVHFSLERPARLLVVQKISLLNILKQSRKLILKETGINSDFYSSLQVGQHLNQEVA